VVPVYDAKSLTRADVPRKAGRRGVVPQVCLTERRTVAYLAIPSVGGVKLGGAGARWNVLSESPGSRQKVEGWHVAGAYDGEVASIEGGHVPDRQAFRGGDHGGIDCS
jgi:hypothetical protein